MVLAAQFEEGAPLESPLAARFAEEEPPSGGVLIRRPQAGSFWRFGAAMLYKRLFCFDDACSG